MLTSPRCGIYKTLAPLGPHVPAGRLVYFHDHGDPGPGVYLPEGWAHNRARFSERGYTLAPEQVAQLEALRPEGLYRVTEAFTCCAGAHRTYAAGTLVQLGYDGAATPIVFVPEWTAAGLVLPEVGQALAADRLARLERLLVAEARPASGHGEAIDLSVAH
jgi:hypothetical protein